jgi:hypothetical protein
MIDKVKTLVTKAAIYIPFNCEGIRINYYDSSDTIDEEQTMDEDYTGRFYGTGEETGEEYAIEYNEVNLEEDSFYGLVLLK